MFRAHVLIIMRSKLHYTASGIITPIAGRLVHDTATYRCDVGTRGNFKLAPQWNSCISVLHTPVENKWHLTLYWIVFNLLQHRDRCIWRVLGCGPVWCLLLALPAMLFHTYRPNTPAIRSTGLVVVLMTANSAVNTAARSATARNNKQLTQIPAFMNFLSSEPATSQWCHIYRQYGVATFTWTVHCYTHRLGS